MSNIRQFPARAKTEPKEADPLDFFTHPPRYPTVQSVGGAVVGQVIVHPSSPDQSRKALAAKRSAEDVDPS